MSSPTPIEDLRSLSLTVHTQPPTPQSPIQNRPPSHTNNLTQDAPAHTPPPLSQENPSTPTPWTRHVPPPVSPQTIGTAFYIFLGNMRLHPLSLRNHLQSDLALLSKQDDRITSLTPALRAYHYRRHVPSAVSTLRHLMNLAALLSPGKSSVPSTPMITELIRARYL